MNDEKDILPYIPSVIRNGDVLVYRAEAVDIDNTYVVKAIQNTLRQRGLDKVLILVLPVGVSIQSLDRNEMRSHGWFRLDG